MAVSLSAKRLLADDPASRRQLHYARRFCCHCHCGSCLRLRIHEARVSYCTPNTKQDRPLSDYAQLQTSDSPLPPVPHALQVGERFSANFATPERSHCALTGALCLKTRSSSSCAVFSRQSHLPLGHGRERE